MLTYWKNLFAETQQQAATLADLEVLRFSTQGQVSPFPATGTGGMTNRRSALRLDTLEPLVQSLFTLLADIRADLALRAQLAEAEHIATALALDALKAYRASATLQDEAQDTRLTAVETKAEATRLALVANAAADTVVSTRTAATEQALATAQTNLVAAQAAAQTAQAKADAADAKAASAKTDAATAINNAAAAQADLTAFKARFREGIVATPPITLQVLVPGTVQVTFATPFADNNYVVTFGKTSNSLLGLDLDAINKTAAGFTLSLKNTGVATLAVAAGTVDYLVKRL